MEDPQDNLTAQLTKVEQIIQEGYVKGLETGLMPRLEIDEFALDKDVLNLFLIALINLQAKEYKNEDPQSPDYWSWFQIAGMYNSHYQYQSSQANCRQIQEFMVDHFHLGMVLLPNLKAFQPDRPATARTPV
jgi:hypothetical protein